MQMTNAALAASRYLRPFRRGPVRRAMRRAKSARAAGDWQGVAAYYKDALAADPELPSLWRKLGYAQKRQGDFVAAEASFRRSLALDDRWAGTHLELGVVLKRQGRMADAAASFLASIRLDPAAAFVRSELLECGYDAAVVEQAISFGTLPFPPPGASSEGAPAAPAIADWGRAAECYADPLRAEPVTATSWVEVGHAQKEQGDLIAAEASYRRALESEPQIRDTRLHLGHVLKLQGRAAEAAESYIEALRCDPGCATATAELAAFGYEPSVIESARQHGSLPFPPAAASVEEADRARATGDWHAAAWHYALALRAQPGWAAIWVQLGHAQKERGGLIAAEVSYRQALAIEPGAADTHLQLGHVLKLQGQLAPAAASYFTAVGLAPKAAAGLHARKELLALGYAYRSILVALSEKTLAWPPPPGDDNRGRHRSLSVVAPNSVVSRYRDDPQTILYRRKIVLPKGETAVFVDIQRVASASLPAIGVSLIGPDGPLPVRRTANPHGDHIATYRCQSGADIEAEFVLSGELPADCLIRRIEIGPPEELGSWATPYRGPTAVELPVDHVRNLIIGTTGVCNASCIHCPTNKLRPSARWTNDMSMQLFDSLVDQLVANDLFITGYISLGLFGDGLLDRNVVERAARLHTAFPQASLHVNTNAAAYNRARHAVLGPLLDTMAIHIETLDEAKYASLMEPLKLAYVLPKIHQIIEDMPGVAAIASPVHRGNIDELREIKRYFADRGVQNMIFTGMSNRCSRDEAFRELALGPTSGSCAEEVASDLIVDWDGLVLVCCNDFLRQEPIGDLKEEKLSDIWRGSKRRRIFDTLRTGAWENIDTCRTCKFSEPAM